MQETVHFIARHGYWLLIAAVLGRQACLPVPANLFLIAAGALARTGTFSLPAIIGWAVIAFVLADMAWYGAGRRWGDRTLHFVCALLPHPEVCSGRATTALAKHGVRILLISKFVVGLDAVAAPLTGAARVPVSKFALFDGVGAMFWSSCYAIVGFIFSNQLDQVAMHVARLGAVLMAAAAAWIAFHLAKRLWNWLRFVRLFRLARISPQELLERLNRGENVLVIDLQGRPRHNSSEPPAIPGAIRMDPWRLEQYAGVEIPPYRDVVLYCASPGELISARVALALRKRGIERVHPLAGGFQAWRNLGFPVSASPAILTRAFNRT